MANTKFSYSPKIRYVYDYRMHVRTEFANSGENSSDVHVSARVALTFPTKCEGVLSISKIELREVLPEPEIESTDDGSTDYYSDYTETAPKDLHPMNNEFAYAISRNNLK